MPEPFTPEKQLSNLPHVNGSCFSEPKGTAHIFQIQTTPHLSSVSPETSSCGSALSFTSPTFSPIKFTPVMSPEKLEI